METKRKQNENKIANMEHRAHVTKQKETKGNKKEKSLVR
jgi:hypothetical protein